MMSRSRLLQTLPFLPLLAFAMVSVYYISHYHVWPLSRDQWHMYVPYFEQGFWSTMLSPMSTHRHIFPFFFFHLDMSLFHGRNHLLAATGALLNIGIICLLLRLLCKENSLSTLEKISLTIFIATQLLWLLNIAQLGWGFMSTQYYLAILTYLLAIYCAYQSHQCQNRTVIWLVICLTCGLVSTFSFGNGILVWPALLYFCWLWRVRPLLTLTITISFTISFILFFILPGGDSVKQALLWLPQETLRFALQLPSGPVFHLLKSWRLLDSDFCKQVATVIGVMGSLTGITWLTITLLKRPKLSGFQIICHSLMLLGLGTAALISLTRTPNFLDVWVDRYQIWGTLFWTGLVPLLYLHLKNHCRPATYGFLFVLAGFPLWAFPSQLDMGSRLYEYQTRVRESLLFYQVGIADKQAAQDALHWNWEHKIPFFISVLQELKARDKNIFYRSPAKYIGKPLEMLWPELAPQSPTLSDFSFISERTRIIYTHDLLISDQENIKNDIAAYQITAQVPEDIDWEYAISLNEKNIITGLGIRIHHSMLPRPDREFSRRRYNFFAVVLPEEGQRRWVLLDPSKEAHLWQSRMANVPQINSR